MIRTMRTVTLAMLSLFITLIASSVFAQYQLRKTTTPTQQKTSITITDPSAKATWEKGQRYTIKWISEGRVPSVKIVLIDQANKSHDLVRSTTNSGSYTFTVSTRLPDGAYKVVVMTADGSVKGEGAGLVTVQKKSFGTTDRHAATGLTQQPRPGSGLSPSQPSGQIGQLPGTTPAVGQAGGVEVAVSGNADVGTVSGGTLSVTQASTSVAARLDQAVMDLYSPPDVQTADVGQYLRINTPAPDDWHTVWEPGGQYWVKWYSSEFGGRCQVVLRESGYYTYRIADDRPSRDSIFFTVPLDIRFSDYYNVIVTQDAPIDTARSVRIKVYQDQPVDLICAVDEFGTNHRGRFDPFGSRTMHFKLGIKNRGTDGPLVVPVLMQLIKHPEAVVVHQVEASIGGVYPGYWYFTEDNLNWDVRQFEESIPSGPGTGVYFRSGHYELKIELDYQNSLNEREDLRYNNSYVRKIRIID